ncbi:MAG: Tm-1-like ATP-binding domain-containing protein [Planctomycetota bacterium]|nr:Tm-1-like ATP-binding domain-containing protein [Pirellulaceae bacterium]MEC8304927.1 Tm-1-like ATP-binding domain-containing protein [Planctomycetota bacterium]
MSIYLIATLDTKGVEAGWIRESLMRQGHRVTLVDVGSSGDPQVDPDIDRAMVFEVAGTSWSVVRSDQDRGEAVAAAARGVAQLIRQHADQGLVEGVLSIGGSAGTSIGTSAMRALPLGIPKVMVSTMASGQVRPYVADKDLCMINSVVDIAGINRVSRIVLSQAADAMSGMVNGRKQVFAEASPTEKPLVAASMFGVTTPCVQVARGVLEQAGYEVLIFHATGTGGQAMESLIREGLIAGVLDITTTELADELVGGVLTAGPGRLTAASELGVPQVISVGALDMVNFGSPETVPQKFADRLFYQHNPVVTLMRTSVSECRQLGKEVGRKVAMSNGPAEVLFPRQGVSAIDAEGQAFEDQEARMALLEGLKSTCGAARMEVMDAHINDPEFAQAAAQRLLSLM